MRLWRESGVVVALGAVAVLDICLPEGFTAIPLLVVVPMLIRDAGRDLRHIAGAGALTMAVTGVLGLTGGPWQAAVAGVSLVGVAAATVSAGRSALTFRHQERALADARAIAETVQRVLLRPIPRRVGTVRAEVRYLAAAAEARVGGDVYDVVSTPFGIRLLIGDVMGSGLEAVETAADLLGAFRELAQHEAKLSGVALRLDGVFAHRAKGPVDSGNVRFATALLVSIPEDSGVAELVCCGHPPPLLLRSTHVTSVESLHPSPPLGLMDLADGWCEMDLVTFGHGDRLLLYTDGVTEARDARGRFFPLAELVSALREEDPEHLLDALGAEFGRHVGGRLRDDAALLLVQRNPDPAVPRDPARGLRREGV